MLVSSRHFLLLFSTTTSPRARPNPSLQKKVVPGGVWHLWVPCLCFLSLHWYTFTFYHWQGTQFCQQLSLWNGLDSANSDQVFKKKTCWHQLLRISNSNTSVLGGYQSYKTCPWQTQEHLQMPCIWFLLCALVCICVFSLTISPTIVLVEWSGLTKSHQEFKHLIPNIRSAVYTNTPNVQVLKWEIILYMASIIS